VLQVVVSCLAHLLQARAFTRWVEATRELKVLRAKAQQVLRNTLTRRMRTALVVWQGCVVYRAAKRAMAAVADRHWRQLYGRHSLAAWGVFIKVGSARLPCDWFFLQLGSLGSGGTLRSVLGFRPAARRTALCVLASSPVARFRPLTG
jgi:hypothetical protein